MKFLIVGVGGVGESIAAIAKKRDPGSEWMELMVLSDYNLERAQEVGLKMGDAERFPVEQVNAQNKEEIIFLADKYSADMIINGCDPSYDMIIFEAAYEAGCKYMDMAMSLSEAHPIEPYKKTHIKLGDLQFARAKQWEDKNLLALVGSGVEPGMVDVFAKYAEKHLFDEIQELGVRDGNNLVVRGCDVAFGFSIWTVIEECLNPPVIWERDKGWFTTEPFSEPEIFILPEGIGPVEMVNVEHEEVLLMPRYIDKGLKRVTFKFGLGDDLIKALKILHALGLDSKEKVRVGDVEVAPRDVVASAAQDPRYIGDKMFGKTCAGIWVKGKKEGLERQVYLYQVADNQDCMKRLGCQVVVAQTAFPPVIMLELVAKGIWQGKGVHGPEYFDPDYFMELMEAYEFPFGMTEMDSEYKRALDRRKPG
ncbi:carboxynorspermidine dehydrogenase [Desulfocucumis palustris]|uniref:Carboxynorspermidine dehydrogenase n=1 Tax=Desulfocucumis palustris TaxID=1898651 RepID=A0A2L2X724_9FIRM|nr:saccharopine dehydrogenase C-terminal domain-containing protein [Desulfocucumis palustris]GBF31868.1 carboxynorspermidine dehydrogenase [Desulfocucumis palustris]